ncbi:MAG: hypothetical protein J5374_10670 [Bacteroidales bacterium]|nr:hypothetical protein [Bacteroidales bacterium]
MKKIKLLDVIPECYVDTNLVEYLLGAGVNHQHSCSKVVGQLKSTFADRFAVGIIDKDKVELGYIKECSVIAHTRHLTLMKHNEKPQYLITVAPAIDRFVLDCAQDSGADTKDYGIPSGLKDFTEISKSITSNTDPRFKALFAALTDNQEIKLLRSTLKYLSENKYNADIASLKRIFNQ